MGRRQQKSAIVVGAGIVGAAASYFLARSGFSVRLLETVAPASGASGAADGAVSVASKRPGAMMDAALAGVALYRELEREGVLAGLFTPRPTLMVAETEAESAVLDGHAGALANAGVTVERHVGAALRARIPAIAPGVRMAVEVHGEGHAIGYQIVNRLIEAGGVAVERACPVHRLALAFGGTAVDGVVTDQGTLHADIFILAAGAGSAALLGLDGVLRPRKGQLLVTDRAPALNVSLHGSLMSCGYLLSKATTGTPDRSTERRYGLVIDPLRTGQFLIGGTREDRADSGNDLPAVQRLLTDALRLMPALAQLRLIRAFAGVRTATADGLPLIGRAAGLQNLIVATGFEGDGICLGPLAGRLVQQMATGATPEIDLAPFDPGRFALRRQDA
ncbi:NAD(P)/FAD-dependent oxidoreductase [Nitratireductor soli]|uniref:NAD(P)/FAD-dependent oxidoreductase n=1 Tax=Nitratireductor soli TaxID=1670619 RepID=UPI00065DD137|nr:FAD-binding oxidoreductase [Nitratireductor soli]